MIIKNIIPITLLAISPFLGGCSASSESDMTSYYMLNNPASSGVAQAVHSKDKAKQRVLLSLEVADYLSSPYLVMQMDEHKIHYATFHMWAELLSDSIFNSLLHDLNAMSDTEVFVPALRRDQDSQQAHLSVSIDYFHVTSQSKVILSGSYEYQGGHRNFSFEATMQEDGYSHSVALMRALMQKLAKQISST
ncbi:PqiC family protein [Shewanella woodyi]|uniref:PqiC family protein n=1 Tax=Shewanella woodyi TaxID=60961 RepID=UPI0007EB0B52|nr:ABC-type transport auxiliary lipoprotein family protein [Shewanella woodyi]